MGEVIEVGGGQFQATQEVVVDQHRRHCDGDADAGGYEGGADRPGHGFQARRARGTNTFQGVHDAPDGAEQADEGRGAADTGEDRQPGFQRTSLTDNLLAQGTFETVLMIDRLAEVGRLAVTNLYRRITGQRHARSGPWQAVG
ncbi:hypothetical protein D3C85_1554680 [compost metagenome]